jgi:branched-chain amino acid transport system permease protein
MTINAALSNALPLAAACALLAVFPFVGGKFYVDLMVTTMILGIFALSLELLVGRTGLVSFGHAAFFGIAAYATALLSPQADAASIAWLLPAVLAIATLAALAVGALSLRTRGIYFIMVTLAFAQMAYFVFHDMKFAGGSDGRYLYVKPVLAIGRVTLIDLDRPLTFYYVTFAALVLVYALLAAVGRARFGHALAGIKANEQRMRAAGFSTYPYKLAAFGLAGALAGVAGFLYAVKDGFVNPEILAWHQSGTVLLMLILGGIGTLRGAVVGAFLFVVLKELFQSEALFGGLARHWQLPLGLTIIACVALMPNGVTGLPAQLRSLRTAVPHAG